MPPRSLAKRSSTTPAFSAIPRKTTSLPSAYTTTCKERTSARTSHQRT
jgi:hypothetical protein